MGLGNSKQNQWKTAEPQEGRDMEEESRKKKSGLIWQTRVMDKVDNPWTVTVMGRHLEVWAT